MEKNNSEKRWLTWAVRIILPMLIALMWTSLSGDLAEVKTEVRELRCEINGAQLTGVTERAVLGNRVTRLEARLNISIDN